MAIILDFSGIAHAAVSVMHSELAGKTDQEYIDIVRHVIITSILGHKKKHTKAYGEMIIACDGPSYWRREVFPHYKAARRKAREESDLNWDLIFKAMHQVREELTEHFPWRVIRLPRCEADDVIACITKFLRTEFGRTEKVLIISSDNDMSQLQNYQEVAQWSPILKKFIKLNNKEVKEYVNTCTVKGQKKDGIPSIKQADDAFVTDTPTRAPSIFQKVLDESLEKGIDAFTDELERTRYKRNQVLFDFSFIPEDIEQSILTEFEKPLKKFNRMDLMNFLIKNRCRQLLTSLEDF